MSNPTLTVHGDDGGGVCDVLADVAVLRVTRHEPAGEMGIPVFLPQVTQSYLR